MNKRLAINMLSNLIAFGVQFGVNFLLTPYIVNNLGSEAYSFVPLSTNLVSYINILTTALNSMASRYISIEINRHNNHEANIYFNSVLAANTIIAIALTIPSLLLVFNVTKIFNVPVTLVKDVQLTLSFVLLSAVISLFFNVFGNVFFIKNRLEISATRNIIGNMIRAMVLILLFSTLTPKIYYITATTLIVSIYTGMTSVVYTKKLLPELRFKKRYIKFRAIKTLLSSGVWNSINQLSVVLLTTLDLYLANMMISAEASGLYSIAKTIPNFIQNIVSVMVGVFVPQFTILYAQGKMQDLLDNINFSIKIMGYFITLPIGFLIVYGQEFFRLWVPNENAEMLHLLSMLTIIPMIVTGSINTIFNVYTVTNKLKIPALVLLVTGIINTILVYFLVKFTHLGIVAIPLVSFVIGILRNLIFTPIYAGKCLEISAKSFYIAIFRGVCCAGVMILVSCIEKNFIDGTSWISLFLAAATCALLAMMINFFFVFSKEERSELIGSILKRVVYKR